MAQYKLLQDDAGVLRDGKDSIPFDNDNVDFIEYQEWLANGNTPDPADVPTPAAEWQDQITATDADLPRYAEDIIDVLTDDQRKALASTTLAAYQLKKKIRSEKPT